MARHLEYKQCYYFIKSNKTKNYGKLTLYNRSYTDNWLADWFCRLQRRGPYSHSSGYCNYCNTAENYTGTKAPLTIKINFK